MTWEQAMARANARAARSGHRQRVAPCRVKGIPCTCGKWWVERAASPRAWLS